MVALGSDGQAGGGLGCEVQATSSPAATEATGHSGGTASVLQHIVLA
jgi:hypothetical protein